jgi:ankyrin repeat protein
MLAAKSGHEGVVTALLARGADVGRQHECGCTALHLAAEKGYIHIVEAILGHGANVDSVNKEGITALMLAAQKNHLDTVKVLMRHGANPMLHDVNGKAVVDYYGNKDQRTGLARILSDLHSRVL